MARYDLDIPDFLASVHDIDALLVSIVDKKTRKPIDEERPIIFADAKHGYYIVAEFNKDAKTGKFKHSNFKLVENHNFVIRRFLDDARIEYYDSDEIEENT